MSLAAAWALYYPIFQAPDEDNHYDYALTLRSAGRPVWPSEGPPQNDTHPSVRYLLNAAGGISLRFDPFARLPPGYGTRAYWRAVDAGAPQTGLTLIRDRGISPVPYLVRAYPLGYYALTAWAIAAAETVKPGSISTQFFTARLFSVLLFAITLVIWWRVFRQMKMARGTALLALAFAALTPMVLQSFSSVQPDCLVSALVAAICLLTLREIQGTITVRGIAALSFLFVMLSITKRHYFVAAAVPSLAALLVAARLQLVRRRAVTSFALLLCLPSVVAWLVTGYFMRSWPFGDALCPPAPVRSPVAIAVATMQALPQHAKLYVESALLGGESMRRFWLAFGWYMEPVKLGTGKLTTAAIVCIGSCSVLLACLITWSLAKNVVRIGRLARCAPIEAASLLTRNVPVTMFLFYAALLLLALSYTNGSITLQARYWLPFVPVIWYLVLCVAPRALSRTPGKVVFMITVAGVAGLLVAALWFTPRSVAARFFEEPRARDATQEVYGAFELDGDRTMDADFGSVRRGTLLRLHGVAVDLRAAAPVAHGSLRIDGGPVIDAKPVRRPTFACDFVAIALVNAGFELDIPTDKLATGVHRVALLVRTTWSRTPIATGTTGTFVVI